jgi:hypothetical protein
MELRVLFSRGNEAVDFVDDALRVVKPGDVPCARDAIAESNGLWRQQRLAVRS